MCACRRWLWSYGSGRAEGGAEWVCEGDGVVVVDTELYWGGAMMYWEGSCWLPTMTSGLRGRRLVYSPVKAILLLLLLLLLLFWAIGGKAVSSTVLLLISNKTHTIAVPEPLRFGRLLVVAEGEDEMGEVDSSLPSTKLRMSILTTLMFVGCVAIGIVIL